MDRVEPRAARQSHSLFSRGRLSSRLRIVASRLDRTNRRREQLPCTCDQLPAGAGAPLSGAGRGRYRSLWLDARSRTKAEEYRLCRRFRRRQSRARRHAQFARAQTTAPRGGRADVAMDRSGGNGRELRQPCRRRSDPPAADDPGAGKKLSRRGRRSLSSIGVAAIC